MIFVLSYCLAARSVSCDRFLFCRYSLFPCFLGQAGFLIFSFCLFFFFFPFLARVGGTKLDDLSTQMTGRPTRDGLDLLQKYDKFRTDGVKNLDFFTIILCFPRPRAFSKAFTRSLKESPDTMVSWCPLRSKRWHNKTILSMNQLPRIILWMLLQAF